jgi:hypothetical protein
MTLSCEFPPPLRIPHALFFTEVNPLADMGNLYLGHYKIARNQNKVYYITMDRREISLQGDLNYDQYLSFDV